MPRPTPRPAPRSAPTRGPSKAAPRAPRRPAAAPPAPPPTAPPTPATFAARAPAGIFRPRVRAEKAFKVLHLRVTPTECNLYELARTHAALVDDRDEPLPVAEALRRLAMLGAVSLGLVNAATT